MQPITTDNLKQYAGMQMRIICSCSVVLCNVRGKLQIGYGFCSYACKLPNGDLIGFSFGQFKVQTEGCADTLIVHIS